jgi:hypothetical protein
MKWLFVLMLLVNAGIAVWKVNFGAPAPGRPVTTSEDVLPGYVNRLLLLGELDEERLRERTADVDDVEELQTDVGAAAADGITMVSVVEDRSLCFSVGPLSDAEDIERVGGWLTSLGGVSDLRESERREVSRFWVFLQPFASRAEALEQVGDMVASSVEDIYVIPRGDMANAISLGLYSHKSSLDRRLVELKAKGFEAQVEQRYESKRASWYDAQFATEFVYPTEAFVEAFPGMEALKTRCG